MSPCRFAFLLAALVVSSISLPAQTPVSALKYYRDGNEKLRKNDLDGAIVDFTKAIDISLRLDPSKANTKKSLSGANGFAEPETEGTEVYVVDRLTADAYTSRGFARYQKGDVDGAMQDFERAIRINPGHASAYLDRGGARYAKGDIQGAIADWDKALRI